MIRRKRRAGLDQFQKTASGEYIYTGAHYGFENQGKSRRRALAELWALYGAAGAACVAGGCIPAPGVGNCAYVLLPYVASLIAACSVLWAVAQLTGGGDPLREYVYEDTVKKLPLRSILTVVCAALACLGEALFLLLNGSQGKALFAALFLVLEAAAAVAAILGRRRLGCLQWSKIWEK